MGITGRLCDFPVTQLLNLVHNGRKTGMLKIESPFGNAGISFEEGKLRHAYVGKETNLAGILKITGKITEKQYRILEGNASQMTDTALASLLIKGGYLAQASILSSLQQFFSAEVRKLFPWDEGFFQFEADGQPASGRIPVRIDLDNLILESARYIRDLGKLQEEIPTLDVHLKFSDRPGVDTRKIRLSREEWNVLSYVHPKNSMRQIAKTARLDEMEVRKVVSCLLQAGLVEKVHPAGLPRIPVGPMFPTKNRPEQVSLLNRLINRIKTI